VRIYRIKKGPTTTSPKSKQYTWLISQNGLESPKAEFVTIEDNPYTERGMLTHNDCVYEIVSDLRSGASDRFVVTRKAFSQND